MSDIIYEFDAYAEGVEEWSTNPGEMVDGVETDYASTTTDGDIQKLTGNECVGTDLGSISKVELRFYGYGDVDDQCILRPVFDGTDDGDNHTVVPGVSAGWKAWQEITRDSNAPLPDGEYYWDDDANIAVYSIYWRAQTFTPSTTHTVNYIALRCFLASGDGTLTVSIRATDGGGLPTGEDLTSGSIDNIPEGMTPYWYRIDVTPYEVTQNTKYAIVIRWSELAADDLSLRRKTDGTYVGGAYAYSSNSGVDWTEDDTYDLAFEEGTDLAWAWPNVQNLDCDVEFNKVSKGNTMYVGMVQIQVTYEAEAPPTGQPMIIRTRGIPTGPGSRIGGGAWN